MLNLTTCLTFLPCSYWFCPVLSKLLSYCIWNGLWFGSIWFISHKMCWITDRSIFNLLCKIQIMSSKHFLLHTSTNACTASKQRNLNWWDPHWNFKNFSYNLMISRDGLTSTNKKETKTSCNIQQQKCISDIIPHLFL